MPVGYNGCHAVCIVYAMTSSQLCSKTFKQPEWTIPGTHLDKHMTMSLFTNIMVLTHYKLNTEQNYGSHIHFKLEENMAATYT